VTPFDENGSIDESNLRAAASWVVEQGVDFVVPCGSNGESELMTVGERARVTEIVADEVSVPVLAGTGHPGLVETRKQTERAAEAGATGAFVVTPFYFGHGQDAFERYYTQLADKSDIPIYLYSVPKMTGTRLEPETLGSLADHGNIHGLKDSTGDMVAFQRERRLAGEDFELFIGNGSLFAQGLDAGADGGVMALANVVPDLTAELYSLHRDGEKEAARDLGADLVELNQAITARYGVAGVKAAMRHRDVPAGHVRTPHSPAADEVVQEVQRLVDDALDR
jgi:dihydrodipicolinate synthase/N-acetylneuraminate lyase